MSPEGLENESARRSVKRRPRGRRMAILTLLMAGVYVWAAYAALNGFEHGGIEWEGVRRINSTRILLGVMMPGQSAAEADSSSPISALPLFGPRRRTAVSDQQRQETLARVESLRRECAATEAVCSAWESLVRGLAGLLFLAAVLSWVTRWGRLWHLLAGAAILAATAATLVGTRYLDIPDGAGHTVWPLSQEQYAAVLDRMERFAQARTQRTLEIPTGGGLSNGELPLKTYLLIAAFGSSYGWILLITFALPRRDRRVDALPGTLA